MKQPTAQFDIELASETLAVVFSECCRHRDENSHSKRSNGKTLFRHFVKENSTSVWKPELVKSILLVKFGGFLHDPPTLLLQADPNRLQKIRDAWSNRLLRSPVGYHIDFVGDVTRIGAKPLSRGRFIPLCDAVCVTINNVTSRDDVATQEAILMELERTFPGVHSPSRELLHETLGKLIRERKVFCTGPGYHLVTKKTYSGKAPCSIDRENEVHNKIDNEVEDCEACMKNRNSFASQVSHRRSFHTTTNRHRRERERKDRSGHSFPVDVDVENLHGSAVPDFVKAEARLTAMEASPQKPARSSEVQISRKSSLAEKVASKIFRRRHKSSSERKPSASVEDAAPKERESDLQVRKLSSDEAVRLGYTSRGSPEKVSTRPSSPRKHRHHSKSPVKQSEGARSGHQERWRSPEKTRHSHDATYNPKPDVIPRSPRTSDRMWALKKERRQTERDHDNPSSAKFTDPTIRSSRRTRYPPVRDAAVSCNLDLTAEETDGKAERRALRRMNSVTVAARKKDVSSPSFEAGESSKRTHSEEKHFRRSKSLRLPRDRRTEQSPTKAHATLSREHRKRSELPDYESLNLVEPRRDMSYDSLGLSSDTQESRRSISSNSTSKEYSYLHACHFAPSIRVGSVIADHLEELERRRRYWKSRGHREMSPTSSLSSAFSDRINLSAEDGEAVVERNAVLQDREAINHDSEVIDQNKISAETEAKQEEPTEEAAENDENLDPETAAALKIAKRLGKMGVKMTRQEWKDYFSSKILPDHVERSLLDAKKQEEESRSESPTSCFGNTSGSVETVIDVTSERSHRRKSLRESDKSRDSDISPRPKSKHPNHDVPRVRIEARSSEDDFDSLKRRPMTGDVDSVFRRDKYTHDSCTDEDDTSVYFTYENSYRHLHLCDKHKKLAAMDSASLTEDSGFHSARERNSLSSREARFITTGTFV